MSPNPEMPPVEQRKDALKHAFEAANGRKPNDTEAARIDKAAEDRSVRGRPKKK